MSLITAAEAAVKRMKADVAELEANGLQVINGEKSWIVAEEESLHAEYTKLVSDLEAEIAKAKSVL